jgi:Uma2 family endonuclease
MAVTSGLTLELFLQMEETRPYSEFFCGEAIQKPVPTFSHASIQGFLQAVIYAFLAQTGLGRILPEFRCIFGPAGRERAFVADLSYVAKHRLPTGRYLYAAPDLAIEILSPDQPAARFLEKVQFYLLNGVRLVWVIDSEAQTIAVLKPGEEGRVLTLGDTLEGDDVLPGFSVPVAEIFAQAQV